MTIHIQIVCKYRKKKATSWTYAQAYMKPPLQTFDDLYTVELTLVCSVATAIGLGFYGPHAGFYIWALSISLDQFINQGQTQMVQFSSHHPKQNNKNENCIKQLHNKSARTNSNSNSTPTPYLIVFKFTNLPPLGVTVLENDFSNFFASIK